MLSSLTASKLAVRPATSQPRLSARRHYVVSCSSRKESIDKRLQQRKQRIDGESEVIYKSEAGKSLTSQNILKAQAESRATREWTGEEYETVASIAENLRQFAREPFNRLAAMAFVSSAEEEVTEGSESEDGMSLEQSHIRFP